MSTLTKSQAPVFGFLLSLGALHLLQGCLSAEDGHPIGSGGACVSWRQTSSCVPSGPREPQNDQACSVPIQSGWSGYCDCGGRIVGASCGHAVFTCAAMCGGGTAGGGSGGGVAADGGGGGAAGSGGGTLVDGGGGGFGGGAALVTPAGKASIVDPCVHSRDNGDTCGEFLGPPADPNVLYVCRDGKTTSTMTCPAGCGVAPTGQDDYCL